MNPELEKVAFALPVGAVSDPLPVEGGYRILKVDGQDLGQRRRPTTPPRTRCATGS